MKRFAFLIQMALLFALGMPAMAQHTAPRYTLNLPVTATAAPAEQSVQFIGTATVLIRYAGLTILTDPNFLHKGDHVHLGYGLTSERLTDPAIAFDQLPPVDFVLLSHLHDDHFDKLVREKLNRATPIVTTDAADDELRKLGFQSVFGLGTWQDMLVTKGDASVRVTSLPGRHGPAAAAALLPSVMGSMLDFAAPAGRYRIYVSGDTMVYDDIAEIPKRFPGVDLALLHLGGTRILGLVTVTMDAEEGVKMLKLIAPDHAIPIHYNDYTVFKSPLSDFQKAVQEAGLAEKVTYLKHGESYRFTPAAKR
ncbi:L-ascorbate metabolism protein UlaG (beta-lactamase superfamily) [Pseudoduganella lurida]|uniref:L-ascorbate metabolism protein UlaG (Beta-lactamase superfamily) n=1 Tax=Pseudoduganella lurida TaxID=1036180 RepID=A0A562QXF1_9BURK|nr:MBL fold metallo-hydrolase [Pseudoduganella lurida]TWI61499.1 L-ascorbate metabolism protein UlaG (beta-lactamase superfamily) [Pseudoduganella lurida]